MKYQTKKKIKEKIKLYLCGVFSGIFIMVMGNHYIDRIAKKPMPEKTTTEVDFKNEFSMPQFEESFNDTKEIAQYVITDFLGDEYVIQADKLRIHSFENGQHVVEEAPKINVPVKNNDYLLEEYISEKEAIVFKDLKNKDNIKNQFCIYLLFERMEELYKEYLNRESFDTLENRKEAIYKVGYDYIVSGKDYSIGGYKFTELPKTIQKDILKIYQKIIYMKKNGVIKEESKLDKFIKNEGKILKYELLKIGR
ncbi:MAG: hypothetical protein PHY26_04230 [Bacilli bacterium]|nr:hypothetical protein [Bacilli bacterium]